MEVLRTLAGILVGLAFLFGLPLLLMAPDLIDSALLYGALWLTYLGAMIGVGWTMFRD